MTADPATLSPELAVIAQALHGDFGDDPQRIAVVVLEWAEALINKNRDYGSRIWATPLLTPNTNCGDAILIRMSDKISRLRNLLQGGVVNVEDESLEDTMTDLGAYCLLWLARPESAAGQHDSTTQTVKENYDHPSNINSMSRLPSPRNRSRERRPSPLCAVSMADSHHPRRHGD